MYGPPGVVLSVAVTVNENGPGVVGVPVSAPLAARVNPGGSVPAVTANPNGPGAPLAEMFAL